MTQNFEDKNKNALKRA